MMRSPGHIRARVTVERERAYTEWQQWSDDTANRLMRLPYDERIRELRMHQDDLTENAWFTVAQSLKPAGARTVETQVEDASAAGYTRNANGSSPASANKPIELGANGDHGNNVLRAPDSSAPTGQGLTGAATMLTAGGNGHDPNAASAGRLNGGPAAASLEGNSGSSAAWWQSSTNGSAPAATAPPPRRTQPPPAANPPQRSRGLAGHLYDLLVGVVTIGAVVAALVWLLSGQIN